MAAYRWAADYRRPNYVRPAGHKRFSFGSARTSPLCAFSLTSAVAQRDAVDRM